MSTNGTAETNPFLVAKNALKNAFSPEGFDLEHLDDAIHNFLSAGGDSLTFLQWVESEASGYGTSWETLQEPIQDVVKQIVDKREIRDHIETTFSSAVTDVIRTTYKDLRGDISEGKITEADVFEAMAAALEELASGLSPTDIIKLLAQ